MEPPGSHVGCGCARRVLCRELWARSNGNSSHGFALAWPEGLSRDGRKLVLGMNRETQILKTGRRQLLTKGNGKETTSTVQEARGGPKKPKKEMVTRKAQ